MKYFIALLFTACSAYSQNKPLNPHPTKFMYPSEPFEGTARMFTSAVKDKLLSKPHNLYVITDTIVGRDTIIYQSSSIDMDSFRLIKDTLYYHEYVFETKTFQANVFSSASIPIDILDNPPQLLSPFLKGHIAKVLTAYQSTLKKKKK